MKKKNKINKIASLIALLLSTGFLILLRILNIIPLKYFAIILIVFLGLNIVNIFIIIFNVSFNRWFILSVTNNNIYGKF